MFFWHLLKALSFGKLMLTAGISSTIAGLVSSDIKDRKYF